ncbi:MAG TPA: alpha/beta hydrolase domain-containing protein [Methylomirabilota bacterium]
MTAFELQLRRPLAGGVPFGEVGAYEQLKGRLRLSVDPGHPANARVTDLDLAPRDASGRVACAADVSILLPVDRRRASGRLLLDVVNRGNTVAVPNFNRATRPVFGPDSDPNPPIDVGDGFLMRRGFVVASCGWQWDVPRNPGLYRLEAPEAQGPDGGRLRGRLLVQLHPAARASHLMLSDRGHIPYAAADLEERDAVLTVRDQRDGEAETIPRGRWRFARADGGRVVADAAHVWLEGGFAAGRIYQVTYTAVGAPVVGLGLVALRECAAWLKHGDEASGNPAVGVLRWAYAYGRSQTGRLLRTLVHDDLNLDEHGREALDGIIANVAGGMRGEFNQRFGQNSKDRPNAMAHLFPFTDRPQSDPLTGRTGALHARLDARGSRLKVMYTNTSAEYHRGDASLIHTDVDGKGDHPLGPHTRVYHFAGTEHGLGVWPPSDTPPPAADPGAPLERAQHLRSVIDYAPLLRACLVNLDRWVSEGTEPPPSRHPRVADSTAVVPEGLASVFARIPAARYPRRHARPLRLDFTTLPPRPGPGWGSLVSAVDSDGNETGGLRLPQIVAPLATHTGWNLRHPDIGGAEQLLVFAGSTIPLPWTAGERAAANDPRPSVEERYASREAYLGRVRAAGLALAGERYLLDADVELCVALAARFWDWLAARR